MTSPISLAITSALTASIFLAALTLLNVSAMYSTDEILNGSHIHVGHAQAVQHCIQTENALAHISRSVAQELFSVS